MGLARSDMDTEPSAERAAERIQAWYSRLEPRLGAYLVDPNVVLTLADARGQTEVYIRGGTAEDVAPIERLSEFTEPRGVRFQAKMIEGKGGRPVLMMNVESLAGYERTTQNTQVPGVARFDARTGWGGVDDWWEDAWRVAKATKPGTYFSGDTDPIHAPYGVVKGYPDEAVVAVMNERRPGPDEEPKLLNTTNVPYSDHYPSAQPNYSYDSKDEAVVARHVAGWGKILEQYYFSDAHRALAADPEFAAARRVADES
ncbi:MAG: hypothetical protein JWN01_886 [Patescibacteria group bacterium]|nr:hypothetical protein [Patescibacteria group bacterium]